MRVIQKTPEGERERARARDRERERSRESARERGSGSEAEHAFELSQLPLHLMEGVRFEVEGLGFGV